jgi:hypothetical protein
VRSPPPHWSCFTTNTTAQRDHPNTPVPAERDSLRKSDEDIAAGRTLSFGTPDDLAVHDLLDLAIDLRSSLVISLSGSFTDGFGREELSGRPSWAATTVPAAAAVIGLRYVG